MRKNSCSLLMAFLAVALVSCGGNQQKNNAQTPDTHTPKISLDWAGTYEGVLPCADCPGIYTLLTLDDDGSYELFEKYLERNAVFVTKGYFEWNATEDSVRLLTDGNPMYFVTENRLLSGDYQLSRISDEEELADSYTKQLIKENASGEDAEVEIYFENNAAFAEFSFNGKTYKLKENTEESQESQYTDGSATLTWNILDPTPLPDYKPTLEADGKKYTFTHLSPTSVLYVTDDAAAPVKAFDVLYFNIEEGKSFAALLNADKYYTLPQTEASAKTAAYEKDGVQWFPGNKKDARLVINGTEYRYKETQFVK